MLRLLAHLSILRRIIYVKLWHMSHKIKKPNYIWTDLSALLTLNMYFQIWLHGVINALMSSVFLQ